MRDRLLASLGWQVVSVPFSEWARLGSLEEQEVRWRARGGLMYWGGSAWNDGMTRDDSRTLRALPRPASADPPHSLNLLNTSQPQQEYLRRRVLSKLQPAEQKQQQQRRQAGPQKQRGR